MLSKWPTGQIVIQMTGSDCERQSRQHSFSFGQASPKTTIASAKFFKAAFAWKPNLTENCKTINLFISNATRADRRDGVAVLGIQHFSHMPGLIHILYTL